MYQLELVFRLLVRLQFMYFQHNMYLSIVVRTNIVYIYIQYRTKVLGRLKTFQLNLEFLNNNDIFNIMVGAGNFGRKLQDTISDSP